MERKKLIKCRTFEDVKQVYGEENLVKLVNIKQIVQYAKMQCQPVWIDEGFDEKLVAYYYGPETTLAWEYWRTHTKTNERNLSYVKKNKRTSRISKSKKNGDNYVSESVQCIPGLPDGITKC